VAQAVQSYGRNADDASDDSLGYLASAVNPWNQANSMNLFQYKPSQNLAWTRELLALP
jgi:hypothetical protein